MINCAVN